MLAKALNMSFNNILILASIIGVATASTGCWWSGCQPNTWAQRGCYPSDKYYQIGSQPCDGGDKYHCCPTGTGPDPGAGSNPNNPGPAQESGICSYYGAEGEIPPGHPTASGEGFDRFAMKAAHKTLPFGTRIRVKHDENGKTVDVVINDRGPFTPGRIVDLTYGAFGVVENHDRGVFPCSFTVI